MFKSNSRFAGLMDDKTASVASSSSKLTTQRPQPQTISTATDNTFKRSSAIPYKPHYYRYSEQELASIRAQLDAESNAIKARQKEEEDKRLQEGLKLEYFQALCETPAEKRVPVVQYSKLTLDAPPEPVEVDANVVRKGWTRINKDPITRKVLFTPSIQPATQPQKHEADEDLELTRDLIHTYYKRSNEYIDLNGYEAWEKHFKFPDWRAFYAEFDAKCVNEDEEEDDDTE